MSQVIGRLSMIAARKKTSTLSLSAGKASKGEGRMGRNSHTHDDVCRHFRGNVLHWEWRFYTPPPPPSPPPPPREGGV